MSLWQGEHGLWALSNHENVVDACGELVPKLVFDVNDINATMMAFAVRDHTDTPQVMTTSAHGGIANLKLDLANDLLLVEVEFDGVILLNERVRVADGTPVVGEDVGDPLGANSKLAHLAELVRGLLRGYAVNGKTTLDIIHQTKRFTGLLNGDHIHEPSRISDIRTHAAINLHQALLKDELDFISSQRVLEAVTDEDHERDALARLVGPGGRLWGPRAAKLVKHPVLWRIETLQVLPINAASEDLQAASVSSGSESPVKSIAAPPIGCSL